MVLQILIILILVTTAYTTQNTDNKEPATSYSIIYRYDTAEEKSDQSSNIKISKSKDQLPKDYEEISIGYDKMPFVYAKIADGIENNMETNQGLPSLSVSDFAPKNIQGNLDIETTSGQQTIQSIPIFQPESNLKVNPQLKNTVTYPYLISAPLIQEGRLITPGLSAYASDSMIQKEPVKSASTDSMSSPDTYVSLAEQYAL